MFATESHNSLNEQLFTVAISKYFAQILVFQLHENLKQIFSGKLQATPLSKVKTKVRDFRFSHRIFYGAWTREWEEIRTSSSQTVSQNFGSVFCPTIPMKEALSNEGASVVFRYTNLRSFI